MNLIKKVKHWWFLKFRYKKVVAQNEVYMVVYRPEPNSQAFTIKSIHKTLKNAKKFHEHQCKESPTIKDSFYIERYGLWD